MKSIMQQNNECYLCGSGYMLECHHIFGGIANRKISERVGLTVLLCHNCHERLTRIDYSANTYLKELGQKEYEKTHTREEFIKLFGKNYL